MQTLQEILGETWKIFQTTTKTILENNDDLLY